VQGSSPTWKVVEVVPKRQRPPAYLELRRALPPALLVSDLPASFPLVPASIFVRRAAPAHGTWIVQMCTSAFFTSVATRVARRSIYRR
jgi:hypothetical protein